MTHIIAITAFALVLAGCAGAPTAAGQPPAPPASAPAPATAPATSPWSVTCTIINPTTANDNNGEVGVPTYTIAITNNSDENLYTGGVSYVYLTSTGQELTAEFDDYEQLILAGQTMNDVGDIPNSLTADSETVPALASCEVLDVYTGMSVP